MRHQTARSDYGTLLWKEYQWGVDYRLYDIIDHAYKDRDTSFEYDDRGYLVRAIYDRKEEQFRTADKLGNLYETKDKSDRVYKSAQLIKTKNATYKYDEEGFLIEKIENFQTWKYTWKANGLLESVSAPKNMSIYFSYDALGRRITKDRVLAAIEYVWDGNVLLHEWKQVENRPVAEDKRITWVFQGFVPVAKLQGGKAYSIISDHLGTPILAVDSDGMEVWNRQLDIYGRVRKEYKHSSLGDEVFSFVPFLYQGQYYDFETNLAYNRYRYYSPETGAYISQDPIRLNGNNPTLYAYVFDSNIQVDVFGLDIHHLIPNAVFRNNRELFKSIEGYIQNVSKKAQDKTNLLDLDKPFHGNHPKYNDYVEEEINNLKKGGLTLEKIKTLQDNLRNHIEKALENFKKTGITLNDYFKKGLHKIECKN